jgi:hypothetical protein
MKDNGKKKEKIRNSVNNDKNDRRDTNNGGNQETNKYVSGPKQK